MAQLVPFTDSTGKLSQEEINSKNISNILDELNNIQSSTGNIIQQPTYIAINDGVNNRALMGYNNTTKTWGIFTTPPGTDLTDATDPQQFSSTSDTPSIAVVKSGTATIAGIGSQPINQQGILTETVAHNLGYIPSFQAFTVAYSVTSAGNPSPLPHNVSVQISSGNIVIYDSNNVTYELFVGVDDTNIYFGNFWNTFNNVSPEAVQDVVISYLLFTTTA